MSLLSTIEYQKGFSELEKKIADYLIEHKEDVIHMNLKELAEATYTSTATISRFCKKVGEKNFNDFRVHFAEITQSQTFSTVNFNKPCNVLTLEKSKSTSYSILTSSGVLNIG